MSSVENVVENALVSQKDNLLGLINAATEVEHLEDAKQLLDFVSPLWRSLDYSYKVREISLRIYTKADVMLSQEEEYLSTCRKNCKTRGITENTILRLKNLSHATKYIGG